MLLPRNAKIAGGAPLGPTIPHVSTRKHYTNYLPVSLSASREA